MIWLVNLALFCALFLIDHHTRLFDEEYDKSMLIMSAIDNLRAVALFAFAATALGALFPDHKLGYLAKFRKLFPIMVMVTLATFCAFVLSMG